MDAVIVILDKLWKDLDPIIVPLDLHANNEGFRIKALRRNIGIEQKPVIGQFSSY